MINLEQTIRETNVKYLELKKEPDNLYKQFQYYCALQELEVYKWK